MKSRTQKHTRRYGQHFLTDRSVLKKIITAADIGPKDTVLEVGPGKGILTVELLKRAKRVLAVEIDRRLCSVIPHLMRDPAKLEILCSDILTLETKKIAETLGENFLIVSNLPYEITTPFLWKFLPDTHRPKRTVLMIQEEVAKRITAKKGEMNLLALMVQYYGTPRIVAKVPPGAFSPPPRVSSAIIGIDAKSPELDAEFEWMFFRLARLAFAEPRKQLRSTLKQELGARLDEICLKAHIDPTSRPEKLGYDEWINLAKATDF